MLVGMLNVNSKRGEPAPCIQCKGLIQPGDMHVLVVVRWGKGQEAIRMREAAMGKVTNRRTGFKYRRLHIGGDCFARWVIAKAVGKREANRLRRGGRPALALSDEEKVERRRLVRRMAEAVRQVLATNDFAVVRRIADRLDKVETELVVKVHVSGSNFGRISTVAKAREKIAAARRNTDETA